MENGQKEVKTAEDVCKACDGKDCNVPAPVDLFCEKIKMMKEKIEKGGEN